MDAQPAQQPTSTTYARPQQPEDSPAAALPTETLIRILELAMEEEDPFERQGTRRSFGGVCYHWHSVVPSPTEYAVSSATEARKLARALKLKLKSASEDRPQVHSLAIRLAATNSVDCSGKTAQLLDACRGVEHLSIDLESALAAVMDHCAGMGHKMYKATKKLKGLRVLELHNEAFITPRALSDMIIAWPSLRTLRLSSKFARYSTTGPFPPAHALRHLEITADPGLIEALLPHLTSLNTPLTLVVRKTLNADPFPTSSVARALVPLASRLDEFAALDHWIWDAAFRFLLLRMINLRALKLHFSIIRAAFATLDLESLAQLRQVTILCPAGSLDGCTGLQLQQVLQRLPISCEQLCLERQLAKLWSGDEKADVERAAERNKAEVVWI
ncbi:hypothetical protein BCR35DRAFT_303834 [Leucosporidium creatinivorum]|uniref:F-box domain-containing protein n=1 Tax=Leucosporidium creatinivorum TaxID=106004 RepID=A0A1Y2FG70_9BASI|nr:hypothetical protein BCR35DRAFT_303834 [Leucosporidium creatinivorum]